MLIDDLLTNAEVLTNSLIVGVTGLLLIATVLFFNRRPPRLPDEDDYHRDQHLHDWQ